MNAKTAFAGHKEQSLHSKYTRLSRSTFPAGAIGGRCAFKHAQLFYDALKKIKNGRIGNIHIQRQDQESKKPHFKW